jgi:hypothetical protein
MPFGAAAGTERHRLADGWQGSTVRAILDNPRYTGYAFFGRWTKHEMLVDPDDVAAGHVTRFRRSSPDRIVRSRKAAHPAVISVEDFTRVQLLRRAKGAGGLQTARKVERSGRRTSRPYLFRGRVRCAVCERKMEASPRAHAMYYRCPARTLAPGSPILATHPAAVYLREDPIRDAVNGWLGALFDRANLDRTVAALVASQGSASPTAGREAARKRAADAGARLRRFQAAIAAGVEVINAAQAERAAAQAEVDGTPTPGALTAAEVYAIVDSLGDLGGALSGARPGRLADLYAAVDLHVRDDPAAHAADVSLQPVSRVNSVRVRGGT